MRCCILACSERPAWLMAARLADSDHYSTRLPARRQHLLGTSLLGQALPHSDCLHAVLQAS